MPFLNSSSVQVLSMDMSCFLAVLVIMAAAMANGEPLVPCLNIFGDSVVDVGNNNGLVTPIKANFLPYGRDFVTHRPTGRFCNGKLASDFTAEYLGFTSYPPAYSSPEANGSQILTGLNFASAASGYYDETSTLYTSISLTQQLRNYKTYQNIVKRMVGIERANQIFSGGIHLLCTGTSDFAQNYYINPMLATLYTHDRFSNILMKSYTTFVQTLYDLGARRIGVVNLPPIGCLPATITLFGQGRNHCVERLNRNAVMFNNKLNSTSQDLLSRLPGLRLVVLDIYEPLLDMIKKPTDNGFFESRKACRGTGTLETSLLCNARSVGTCSNATGYVFWDSFHPSEAANHVLAGSLLSQGISLIS